MTAAELGLSARQIEIFQSVADGVSLKAIADRFGIAPESVSRSIARANESLGTKTKAHAVAALLRKGLIE